MTPTQHTDRRAQTTLDFAIAMGVFLLAVAFVFTFIPSLTAPFVDGNQEQSAVADRIASHLVEGSLAHPDEPYILNVTCTTGMFDSQSGAAVAGCGYNTSTTDYRERIGVSDRPAVNLTLVRINSSNRDEALLCDDGSGNVVNATDANCSVPYAIGGNYSGAESVTVARRVVSIDGRDATLLVRVW